MAGVVIIAIDASAQAEAALQWYLDHIHRDGNRIVILHCVDLSRIDDDAACSSSKLSTAASWEQERVKIKQLDDKYRWKLNEIGLAGTIRTESGKPGDVIVRAAKEEKAGLICIGSRGLGMLKRTVGGSVSDYVLHHAHCPVIICRQREGRYSLRPEPKDSPKSERGSPKSERGTPKSARGTPSKERPKVTFRLEQSPKH